MTQAFNLSQLANGVNTSGQLNAATYLYNQVSVANGGTGLSTLPAGYIPYGNGTSAFGSSTNLFYDTANVRLGIGTSSPSKQLTVVSDASISGLIVGKGGGAVASNTAVGSGAMSATATGTSNSAFGLNALNALTSGSNNSGFGGSVLGLNTTGSNNTAMGHQTLISNTTASNNTAVGYQAGYTGTTAYRNSLYGYQAGYSLTTGFGNTFIGTSGTYQSAGYYVTTGNNNTVIGGYNGNGGGLDIRTASNYIVLSDGDGNPRQVIDSSGNVGIGTTSPSTYSILTAYGLSASGFAGITAINGSGSSGSGGIQFGSDGTYVKAAIALKREQANGGGSLVFYNDSNADAANWATTDEKMRIDFSGRLGVGTTPYSWASGWTPIDLANSASIVSTGDGNLVSTGNCYYNGSSWIRKIAGYAALTEINSGNSGTIKTYTAGSSTAGSSITLTAGPYVANLGTSWTTSSDERLKDIIEPITNAANKVSTLRAVIGKFKTDPDDKRRSFLIAQDVQIVLPEAVDATDPDSLGVQYTDVIPLLVAAIKEQQALITALTARITALEAK